MTELERKKKLRNDIIFWSLIFFRFFFVDYSMVPSCSMTPTFRTGDFVLTWKRIFRWSRLTLPYGGYLPVAKEGIVFRLPKHGDTAIFILDRDPKVYYLKRVVGVEGDTVQMIDGVLHINDKPSKIEFLYDLKFKNDEGHLQTGKVYEVTLFNGAKYRVFRHVPFGKGHIDNTKKYTVPRGFVWVQGDYHTGSADSFSPEFMGPVPTKNVHAQPFFIVFSSLSRETHSGVGYVNWLMQIPQRIFIYFWYFDFSRFMKFPD